MSLPCSEHDRICKIEERLRKGDINFGTMSQTLNEVHTLSTNINKKLFIDNGSRSMQSRLNDVEAIYKLLAEEKKQAPAKISNIIQIGMFIIAILALWLTRK